MTYDKDKAFRNFRNRSRRARRGYGDAFLRRADRLCGDERRDQDCARRDESLRRIRRACRLHDQGRGAAPVDVERFLLSSRRVCRYGFERGDDRRQDLPFVRSERRQDALRFRLCVKRRRRKGGRLGCFGDTAFRVFGVLRRFRLALRFGRYALCFRRRICLRRKRFCRQFRVACSRRLGFVRNYDFDSGRRDRRRCRAFERTALLLLCQLFLPLFLRRQILRSKRADRRRQNLALCRRA